MTISTKTTKMLWGRAAARCSISHCRVPLVIEGTETDNEALIGDMCHIVAESPDGPRGHSTLTREERDEYDNLILLCRNHHRETDEQPGNYPINRLKQIKEIHEKWVRESLPGYDSTKQRDDEIYAGYVDEWARRCDLDGWKAWTSYLLGPPTRMSGKRDAEIAELRSWLLSRVWPGRYPDLERSFENFRRILIDFQEVFREHAVKPYPDEDLLRTEKFYKLTYHDQETYDRLSALYDHHVALVEDLVLELTRAANLVCERVRESILPNFRLGEGWLMVVSGPYEGFTWEEYVVQYSVAEKAALLPYPGLSEFFTARSGRDRHFGQGPAPQI